MKSIQIIDGANNCVYDIFSATDEEFAEILLSGADVAFIDEVYLHGDQKELDAAFKKFGKGEYQSRVQMVSAASFCMSLRRKSYITLSGKMNMPSTQMVPICDRGWAPIHVHRHAIPHQLQDARAA